MHYNHEPEIRVVLDMIEAKHFSHYEPGVFLPIHDMLLTRGDHYMHLADLTSYLDADHILCELYRDSSSWAGKAILNIGSSGKFSSDRTIAQYTTESWNAQPCPIT